MADKKETKVSSYEEVEATVVDYLKDKKLNKGKPSIQWAPTSEDRWELVAFAPGFWMAVIDSIYATPEDAKRIMKAHPEVTVMVFQ